MRRISSKVGVGDGGVHRGRGPSYICPIMTSPNDSQSPSGPPVLLRRMAAGLQGAGLVLHRAQARCRRAALAAGRRAAGAALHRRRRRARGRAGVRHRARRWPGRAGWPACWRSVPPILITRALHEDGLADTADGLGPHALEPARRLEIMRDSRNGTFGVLALALSVLIKVACLAQFSGSTGLVVLIAAHALSRAVIAYPLLAFSPVHADGLGAQAGKPTDNDVWLTIGLGAALAFLLLLGKGFFVALLAPIAAMAAAWGASQLDRQPHRRLHRRHPGGRPAEGRDRLSGGGGAVHRALRRAHSVSLPSAARDLMPVVRCDEVPRLPLRMTRDDRRSNLHGDGRQDHGIGHALVVGPARAGAQPRSALLRPDRQGLRREQPGAVRAPGQAAAQGRGLVRLEPVARAQDRRASRQGRRRDGQAQHRSRSRRAAFRRMAGPHLPRDRREARQQPPVLARSAGIPAARR